MPSLSRPIALSRPEAVSTVRGVGLPARGCGGHGLGDHAAEPLEADESRQSPGRTRTSPRRPARDCPTLTAPGGPTNRPRRYTSRTRRPSRAGRSIMPSFASGVHPPGTAGLGSPQTPFHPRPARPVRTTKATHGKNEQGDSRERTANPHEQPRPTFLGDFIPQDSGQHQNQEDSRR